MTASLDLDHLGIAVNDLDAASARFRALGFTLTDKGFHVAAQTPGGPLVRTGTGNHCMMLGRGYVELIAVTDPAYQGRLRSDLARYEGLHLVSFGSADAEATADLFRRTTGQCATIRRVTRPIAERGVPQTAVFDIVDLPDEIAGFGHFFAIRHLTRDVVWQPHLLTHANGAAALVGAIACVEKPAAWLARVATALDAPTDGGAIALTQGRLEALDPPALAARFPGMTSPALPALAGLTLAVADLAGLARHLTAQGLPYAQSSDRLWVAAAQANGTIIEFVNRA